MSVAICTPFIDTGCGWRTKARDFTRAHWGQLGVPVVYGTDDGDPINRAAARNDAVRQSGADIIVFADADTWIEAEQFWPMVERAEQTNHLIHGYTDHMHLSKAATLHLYDGDNVRVGQVIANQPSGIMAAPRSLLDVVGGHDERFIGWGGEDRAFQLACETLAGRGVRIRGLSYHLWHPNALEKGRGSVERRRNIALAMRYKEAAGTPKTAGIVPRTHSRQPDHDAMRAILSEPGGPLAGRTVGLAT